MYRPETKTGKEAEIKCSKPMERNKDLHVVTLYAHC
jgi:hypothetical protein